MADNVAHLAADSVEEADAAVSRSWGRDRAAEA